MNEPVKKLRFKEDLFPKDGFVYRDADNVQHMAANLPSLVKAVSSYRVRTGRPLGDPEQDILGQLCKRQPALCNEYVTAHQPDALTRSVASDAVKLFTAGNFDAVAEEEANLRASLCLKCRARVPWGQGCPPCLKQGADMIAKMLERLPKHKALANQACLHALDDLQLAVWKSEGREVLNPPADSGCWRERQ